MPGYFTCGIFFAIQNLKIDIDACSLLWRKNFNFAHAFSVDIETLLLMKIHETHKLRQEYYRTILNNMIIERKQIR